MLQRSKLTTHTLNCKNKIEAQTFLSDKIIFSEIPTKKGSLGAFTLLEKKKLAEKKIIAAISFKLPFHAAEFSFPLDVHIKKKQACRLIYINLIKT